MLNNSFRLRYKNVPAAIYLKQDCERTLLHNHDEFEILIIEKGEALVRVGKNTYSCKDGDLIFINPSEIHSIKVNPQKSYRQKCICFDTSLVSDAKIAEKLKSERLSFLRHISKNSPHNAFLTKCASNAYNAVSSNLDAVYMEVSAYVTLIAAYMLNNRLYDELCQKTDGFYSVILKYISEHFPENITSADAAKEASYTHSYFCRRFKSGFGMSFSEYLTIFRITCAKQIMETSEKTLAEISDECGFSAPTHFSSAFKKYVGISPLEYRKKSI